LCLLHGYLGGGDHREGWFGGSDGSIMGLAPDYSRRVLLLSRSESDEDRKIRPFLVFRGRMSAVG
jgi:hypothetical protein